MGTNSTKLLVAAAVTGLLLIAIFATTVLRYRSGLGAAVRETIIGRDAAVLHPFALQQLADARAAGDDSLTAVLHSANMAGVLAVAVFDADGRPWRYLPESLLFADLPLADLLRLQTREPISRFHAQFPLDRYFSGVDASRRSEPVLEILLPLYRPDAAKTLVGFAQYLIDARPLVAELAAIDGRIRVETATTLLLGGGLIAVLAILATVGLLRSQRIIAERNARLTRANFELTLAAKAGALGQITSHLMHGLQGPVAGLRAAMAGHAGDHSPDWRSAADYTERVQAMVQETVALLGDTRAQAHYELTGDELAALIRERNSAEARTRGVDFTVNARFAGVIDSHRGGLLCLVANNLVQNALQATPRHGAVAVNLVGGGEGATLTVSDEGPGIPDELRARLFEPGYSGRKGGSGLGLAISRLIARQMGAELTLERTGPGGTTFALRLPQVPV